MRHIVVAGLFACAASLAAADTSAPATPDAALDAYARPAMLVDIGGRKLNLRCSGSGSPTVLLESGANADSLTWRRVQPRVAASSKVCSYDRAGFGFSDEGPLPRNVDTEAADLHALIHAAHLELPIVLVGHSLGTNIVRRYADKHAADVAGIVLVDPWPQRISEFSADWVKTDNEMRTHMLAFAAQCEKGAAAGQLKTPAGDLAPCIRADDPQFPAALNAAIHAQKERPPFWHTLMSESQANITLFEEPIPASESRGALPLIVLSADSTFDDAPPEGKKALEAARQKTHKLLAASSTRGERRWVAHSTHDIQLDQPDAVVTAIADVSKQASRKAAPVK